MYRSVENYFKELTAQFETIPAERKEVLARIAAYIQSKHSNSTPTRLMYVCTHNSRRSHFGQVAAAVAAEHYKIPNFESYSGGTEATAFNSHAINALTRVGFKIETKDKNANPKYDVFFGNASKTVCFSKVYNHESNPRSGFAAIMTCTDAEQNCPFIPGVELRIATPYEDPKNSDDTALQDKTYSDRFKQIATEIMYTFSLVE